MRVLCKCGTGFNVDKHRIKEGRGKYCSRPCAYKYRTVISGSLHHNWRGDNVGYSALHQWVKRHLGAPNKCTACGTTNAKQFEWANISGNYKRSTDDWIRLCGSCHNKHDDIANRGWATKKAAQNV